MNYYFDYLTKRCFRFIALSLLLLALSGCIGTKTWIHPTKTSVDFKSDDYECQLEAEQRVANKGQTDSIFVETYTEDYKGQCLEHRGWLSRYR